MLQVLSPISTPDMINTNTLDLYVKPDVSTLWSDLFGSSSTCIRSFSSINEELRKNPQVVVSGTFIQNNALFHRIHAVVRVGSDGLHDEVAAQTARPQYVEVHGHGNQDQPTGIRVFVPLSSQKTFAYAHQQMLRFGNICNSSLNPACIHGTYSVVNRLAIIGESVFGIHATVSVNSDKVLLSDFQDLAQCRIPKETWFPCITVNHESQPIQRPRVDDLDSQLFLHLLELVMIHSPSAEDCFMAAYYSFVLAEFLQDNPNYHTRDEDDGETKFVRLLKFGSDGVILSLVIKAGEYLDHSTVTVANYFDLEMILYIARRMAK